MSVIGNVLLALTGEGLAEANRKIERRDQRIRELETQLAAATARCNGKLNVTIDLPPIDVERAEYESWRRPHVSLHAFTRLPHGPYEDRAMQVGWASWWERANRASESAYLERTDG